MLDYVEQHDAGHLVAHGVVVGDGFWWFDSYGFTPTAPGSAHWDGDELVLDRRSERGRTIMRIRAEGDRLSLDLDTAVPADADPVPLVRGSYTRDA